MCLHKLSDKLIPTKEKTLWWQVDFRHYGNSATISPKGIKKYYETKMLHSNKIVKENTRQMKLSNIE